MGERTWIASPHPGAQDDLSEQEEARLISLVDGADSTLQIQLQLATEKKVPNKVVGLLCTLRTVFPPCDEP